MVKPPAAGAGDTRQRLIDATLELVAARGFDGVSVGDIEAAAGLAPRSGAIYKYFESKLAVLEAGLEQHLTSVEAVDLDLASTPVDQSPADEPSIEESVAEIELMARWLLAELDRESTITHVVEREGDRLPALRDRMREGVSDRGYRVAAAFINRATANISGDQEALAVLLIGGLINVRRSTWTFGQAPLGIDDERFVATFTSLARSLLERAANLDGD